MINNDRIVPVTETDLITLYGTMMKLAGKTVTSVSAVNTAEFEITSGSGNMIADEPVETVDFGKSVTSAVIYFVPAYNYKGFSIAGTAVTTGGVTVNPDGRTLYSATLASGAVTIAQIGF